MAENKEEPIVVIYDGDCPICRNIMLKRRLETRGHDLQLVNARELSKVDTKAYVDMGLDLNDGMIVKYQGENFFGHQGLKKLVELSSHQNRFYRLFESFYRKHGGERLYKLLVKGRLLLLKLKGINLIDS